MSVTLTGSGGLGVRLGKMFGACANSISFQGGTATTDVDAAASMSTHVTDMETEAAQSPVVTDQIDGVYTMVDAWRSAQGILINGLKSLAEKVTIRQVHLDATLSVKDITSAIKELQRQMRANSTSIQGSTVSAGAQTAVGSPVGTPKLIISVKNADGYTLQTPFAETIRFTVSADAQTGGATARNETMSIRGAAAVSDTSSYLWPAGSGCSATISLSDAQSNNTRNTLLFNGGFETFNSTNTPGDWVVGIGAAGTDVFPGGSGYSGSNSLKILGDNSTLVAVRQTFNTAHSTSAGSGGTPAILKPNTQYAVGFWCKMSATPSAGVLRVALTDGSGTVVNDVAGTANSFTVALTGLSTTWVFSSGSFRTPAALPSTGFKLELKTTTAIDTAKYVLIDDVVFYPMTQLYNGGPSVLAVAGVTNVILADQWTSAISSSMGVFASWMERFFSMRDKGLQLPYAASSPTIDDALVV